MEKSLSPRTDSRLRRGVDNIILFGPFLLAAFYFAFCVYLEVTQTRFPLETRNWIYRTSGNITFFLSLLLNMLYGRKYKLGILRSILYALASFELVFSLASVQWSHLDVARFTSGSVASFRSTILLPVLCFILSRFDKQRDMYTLCDFLTPYYFFQHGITTHACWITGCCAGMPMSWGVFNPNTEQYAFPAQPYAIILALGVSLWGLLHARKKDYQTRGEVFAVSLMVYGAFRFLMEFFTDNTRIFRIFSLYSLYALLMVILGILVFRRKPDQPVEINKEHKL